MDLGLHVMEYPTGRFGYVGSVPTTLAFTAPDGGPADPAEVEKACSFGQRFGKVKSRTFATKEEAVAFASEHGYKAQ
jgi:hypothetical protein